MAGQANKRNLFDLPLERMQERKLGELRAELGIDVPLLKHLYGVEQKMIASKASHRLSGSIAPTYEPVNCEP